LLIAFVGLEPIVGALGVGRDHLGEVARFPHAAVETAANRLRDFGFRQPDGDPCGVQARARSLAVQRAGTDQLAERERALVQRVVARTLRAPVNAVELILDGGLDVGSDPGVVAGTRSVALHEFQTAC
jgi:hypothetical protein